MSGSNFGQGGRTVKTASASRAGAAKRGAGGRTAVPARGAATKTGSRSKPGVNPLADRPLKLDADGLVVMRLGWREAIERTVGGLHYELVDVERAARGLLRVTIDRLPGHPYAIDSEFVTVEDCELVTRQLQFALEVDGVDYARLEVSSPGLDRPLKREADYARFTGESVSITLKEAFEGRKVFKGVLGRGEDPQAWTLTFVAGKLEQVLGFRLDEVREARLVPVLDFKGRRSSKPADVPAAGGGADVGGMPAEAPPGDIGG